MDCRLNPGISSRNFCLGPNARPPRGECWPRRHMNGADRSSVLCTGDVLGRISAPIRTVPESRCGVTWTGKAMKSVCFGAFATALSLVTSIAKAEMASIYGGRDGLCGSRTANGERLNCAALTAAHRKWRFSTLVRVCHNGCVTVRVNDRGPWVKGRDIDLSPAAGKAIGISSTGHVTLSPL